MDAEGMKFLGVAIMMAVSGSFVGVGEAWVCTHAFRAMGRNPQVMDKLFTNMIVACAIVESTAIYNLVVSLIFLFVA